MSDAVYVIYGGMSVERPVSLRSGKAVIDALHEAGYDVKAIDMTSLKDIESIPDKAVVLPILHGKYGEDGIVQKILESKNIKFLGSSSTVSKNAFDKVITREIMNGAGLPVPKGAEVNASTYNTHPLKKVPHVLKVARGGSAIGTVIVRDPKDMPDVGELVFKIDPKAVIEELIEGIEVSVPILNNRALPLIEIRPPEHEEFDYENRYNGKTEEICPAISIPAEKQKDYMQLALEMHKVMDCRGLSRVDMMIDRQWNPKILEINTMPGLTNESLFPLAARTVQITMPQLVEEFVKITKEG